MVRYICSKIKYIGDSIGDDIQIQIACLEKSVSLNKRIKNGTELVLNVEVGQFFTDSTLFTLSTLIKIIEKDAVFNDVGVKGFDIKIDLDSNLPQSSAHIVEVSELSAALSKRKAIFEITMVVVVSDAILYVSYERGKGGWTDVIREIDQTRISLPSYTQVQLEGQNTKRQYFIAREGVLKGTKASIKIASDGVPYLQPVSYFTDPVYLTYSLSTYEVRLGSAVYVSKNYPDDPKPWKKGVYDIEIPDAPHLGGLYYLATAKLAKVWFRIGHTGDRYLHIGTHSKGCVTLIEVGRWDELCRILLKARKGDGQSVGVLEIID